MSGCLGEVAAALVDGELDHAAREKAHRHLAHCAGCRAEVDAQRRLRARLTGLAGPDPSRDLIARLHALPGIDRLPGPLSAAAPIAAVRPVSVRPVSVRPAPRASGSRGPDLRLRRGRRRALAGSALAVVGVAAALALGSPPARPASTPIDPGADAFVTQFVDATNPDLGPAVQQASLVDGGRGSRP